MCFFAQDIENGIQNSIQKLYYNSLYPDKTFSVNYYNTTEHATTQYVMAPSKTLFIKSCYFFSFLRMLIFFLF